MCDFKGLIAICKQAIKWPMKINTSNIHFYKYLGGKSRRSNNIIIY